MLVYLDEEDIRKAKEHPDFFKIDYKWNGTITFYTIEAAGHFYEMIENEIQTIEMKCANCSIDIRKDEFSDDVVREFEDFCVVKYHKFVPPKGKSKNCDKDEKVLPWSVSNFIKKDFKMLCQTCRLDDTSECKHCGHSLCNSTCESTRWVKYMTKSEKQ